jgi:hypothetical protein
MRRVWARHVLLPGVAALAIVLGITACGGSASPSTAGTSNPNPTSGTGQDQSANGDIPDTATFLKFQGSHYSLEYVEGWVQQTLANDNVLFTDKDSFVKVTLQPLPSGSLNEYVAGPGMAQSAQEFHQFTGAKVMNGALPAGASVLVTFQALSAPDTVTGKSVTITVNRYFIQGPQFMAILTQAAPLGVDNVDAFLRIARSFTWKG